MTNVTILLALKNLAPDCQFTVAGGQIIWNENNPLPQPDKEALEGEIAKLTSVLIDPKEGMVTEVGSLLATKQAREYLELDTKEVTDKLEKILAKTGKIV